MLATAAVFGVCCATASVSYARTDVAQLQRSCELAWTVDRRPTYVVTDVAVRGREIWATSSHERVILRSGRSGWRSVAMPAARTVEDVAAEGTSLWLLGDRSVFRWTGSSWRQFKIDRLPPARNGVALTALDVSDARLSVGGRYDNGDGENVMGFGWVTARLTGSRWTSHAGAAAYSYISAIDSVDARYAWAVGGIGAQIGDSRAVLLRWDGSRWRDFGQRNSVIALFDVLALSRKEAWAVGSVNIDDYGTDEPAAILRWNGVAWARSASPRRTTLPPNLYSLAAFGSRDVWAGGQAAGRPVLLHWDGTKWSYSQAPPVLGAIRDLAAAPDGRLWAVGDNFIAHARCR